MNTILKNVGNMKRAVSIATRNRLVANGTDADLIKYYGFAKLKPEVVDDFNEVAKEEIFQIMLSCRKDEYRQILQNTMNAKITAWWDRAADIIPANSGKGAGIEKILEYFQLSKEEAIAFGDGDNDLEMFQAVGTGVAMGNASENLKSIASSTCGCASEDGIYHYCVEHGLIKEYI